MSANGAVTCSGAACDGQLAWLENSDSFNYAPLIQFYGDHPERLHVSGSQQFCPRELLGLGTGFCKDTQSHMCQAEKLACQGNEWPVAAVEVFRCCAIKHCNSCHLVYSCLLQKIFRETSCEYMYFMMSLASIPRFSVALV